MRAVGLVVLAGCGRIGFDSTAESADARAWLDAPPTPAVCGTTDPCNGIDDDCDLKVDEDGCPTGCSGFLYEVQSYVFCVGVRAFDPAQAACTTLGASLVRVDNAGEDAWLRSTASSLGLAYVWLGAADSVVELEWRWRDGTQFWQGLDNGMPIGGLYNGWLAGEPNDSGNREDCALLWTDGPWRDFKCDDPNPYICEL